MSFTVQHKRSGDANRRPLPRDLTTGQLAVNYNQESPGLFFRTLSGDLIKAGPAQIGTESPRLENWTNYSVGEFWVDISRKDPNLKVWNGARWLNLTGFSEARSSLVPDASCQYTLGSQLMRWNSLYLCDMDLDDRGIIPTRDGALTLGSPSRRWDYVYTNDLCLSNEGSQNDVDGTWGSYVIQEGEEDLFLINKRSGKKFKFVLEEVS